MFKVSVRLGGCDVLRIPPGAFVVPPTAAADVANGQLVNAPMQAVVVFAAGVDGESGGVAAGKITFTQRWSTI